MWKQLRGQGLSYSYRMSLDINEGIFCLSFAYATSLLGSFKETKAIIEKNIQFKNTLKVLLFFFKLYILFVGKYN